MIGFPFIRNISGVLEQPETQLCWQSSSPQQLWNFRGAPGLQPRELGPAGASQCYLTYSLTPLSQHNLCWNRHCQLFKNQCAFLNATRNQRHSEGWWGRHFQTATMCLEELLPPTTVSSQGSLITEHRHTSDILGCSAPSRWHNTRQTCTHTLLLGKAGEVRLPWTDSCCSSTVGTRQPKSTETFSFRVITPGREELTQMVSKFARKQ